MGSSSPAGIKSGPLEQERGVLAAGPAGMSQAKRFKKSGEDWGCRVCDQLVQGSLIGR